MSKSRDKFSFGHKREDKQPKTDKGRKSDRQEWNREARDYTKAG
jgi:hypothetical protein